jgi:hypothetical protein
MAVRRVRTLPCGSGVCRHGQQQACCHHALLRQPQIPRPATGEPNVRLGTKADPSEQVQACKLCDVRARVTGGGQWLGDVTRCRARACMRGHSHARERRASCAAGQKHKCMPAHAITDTVQCAKIAVTRKAGRRGQRVEWSGGAAARVHRVKQWRGAARMNKVLRPRPRPPAPTPGLALLGSTQLISVPDAAHAASGSPQWEAQHCPRCPLPLPRRPCTRLCGA